MVEWVSIEKARRAQGLRLVLSVGVPGPWGELAKAIVHVKHLPHVRVAQQPGDTNDALASWTGIRNAPQLVHGDEPAVDRWTDILFLAERLAPEPALIPADAASRVRMFGLMHELCGEQGLGWTRRLMIFAPVMRLPDAHPIRVRVAGMASRYGYSPSAAEAAPARAAAILRLFGEQLARQRDLGREYLIGERLSALDLAWATFAALIEPLPEAACAMSEALRASYTAADPAIAAALDRALLAHRDRVYERWLELPVDLGP